MEYEDYLDEQEIDAKDILIRKLQHGMFLISALHCGDGHPEEETCIYCGTKFPCFTAKVARKSATNF